MAVVSILLYGCTTWTLTKRMVKILIAITQEWCEQYWTSPGNKTQKQLYGHLPPILKTTQVRWTRHAGHCWISQDELISGILLWTPSHRQAKARRRARTYIQQLCADTRHSIEDLPGAKTIETDGERVSKRSMLAAWHDDDDDDDLFI